MFRNDNYFFTFSGAAISSDNKVVAGQCSGSRQSLYDFKFECEDFIRKSKIHTQIEDSDTTFERGDSESISTNTNIHDEVMLKQKASNEIAVIVSVSIVSTVVLLTIFMFIYLKWCKRRVQDWIKEYKWRHHDAHLAHKSSQFGATSEPMVSNMVPVQQNQYHPYLKGDNYIYTSPRLHHTYVYHGQSPLHSAVSEAVSAQQFNTSRNTSATNTNTDNNTAVIDNDDEYFYVSNHFNHQDTAVVMNNGGYSITTTTAKHIPVTVL